MPDPAQRPLLGDEETVCGNVDLTCGDSGIEDFVEIDLSTPEAVKTQLVGLTQVEANQRIKYYGANEVPKKEVKWYMILFRQFTGSMAIMIELAMALAAAVQKWDDFSIIATLLMVNTTIGFYEEYEALKKVEGIKSKLAKETNVKREGEFVKRATRELVPGDVIFLRGGDQVPADCDYLAGDPMQVRVSRVCARTRCLVAAPRRGPRRARQASFDDYSMSHPFVFGLCRCLSHGSRGLIGVARTPLDA